MSVLLSVRCSLPVGGLRLALGARTAYPPWPVHLAPCPAGRAPPQYGGQTGHRAGTSRLSTTSRPRQPGSNLRPLSCLSLLGPARGLCPCSGPRCACSPDGAERQLPRSTPPGRGSLRRTDPRRRRRPPFGLGRRSLRPTGVQLALCRRRSLGPA